MPSKRDPQKTRASKALYRATHQEEERAQQRAWRAAHSDKVRAHDAAKYKKHRAKILARVKARAIAKREEIRIYQAAYQAKHREQNRQRCAARYAQRSAEYSTNAKKWRQAHPEANAAKLERRRAHKLRAPRNDFTAAQWKEMQAAYQHRCYYCGKRAKGHLTQDHIQPLSKGGAHTLHNIVPACRPCNSHKHANLPHIPVQPLLLTLAPARH